MRQRLLVLIASLALGGCAATSVQPVVQHQVAPAAVGRGIVSAADPRAAEAGAQMLRQGGSAADAALATLLALTVVEPQSSGIGGGGFLVYEDGDGTPATYDGREEAPMAATPDWFLRNGQPLSFDEAVPGGRSVGVPGNLRMMALAHRDQGRLAWKALFGPAIALARDGFRVTPRFHTALAKSRSTGALSPEGQAIFYPGGEPAPVGTLIRNPLLAATLERLSRLGADSFYVGQNAHTIVAKVTRPPTNPAPMAVGDFAAYHAQLREPVCSTYRSYRICGMGPPSSGGIAVIQILKQLERFDLAAFGPNALESWHLIAESMRLAFADRDRYVADPDHVAVPIAGLIDPAYLASRSALISTERAMTTAPAGSPPGAPRVTPGVEATEAGTSHFVAVDRWGEVASLTSTIEGPFGSGLMANGYYLNNELTDFSFVPAKEGVPVANRVEAGKRPRSSMAPTIVYGPDGRVRLALGAAGGATIIAQVAKAIIAVIDWKLPAREAIALPVLFAPGDTLFVERGSAHEAMIPSLQRFGHKVELRDPGFKANAIERTAQGWSGAADPRSEGTAVSE